MRYLLDWKLIREIDLAAIVFQTLESRMPNQSLQPHFRAALYRRLEAQDTDQEKLDQMFRLLGEGEQAAQRAQLTDLAGQFADGKSAVLETLRGTGHFLNPELAFIRLGLAVGDVRSSYRYLAAHYTRLIQFEQLLRRNLWLPLAVCLIVIIGLPVLGVADGMIAMKSALWLIALPLLIGLILAILLAKAARHWRQGALANAWVDVCYRLPGVGLLLAQQQSLHYFSNLSLCMRAGLPLAQSLQLSVEALPYSPRRAAFEQVRQAVAGGGRLSDALRASGALSGVLMRNSQVSAPSNAGLDGAALAQQVLTESTRLTVIEGLDYWGRWLPMTMLLALPLVLLGNWLAMAAR